MRNNYNNKTDLKKKQVKFCNRIKTVIMDRQQNNQTVIRKLEDRAEWSTYIIVRDTEK